MIDWEERYQVGDMPWEKGAPSPGLLEYFETHPPLDGKILVPGCGLGHDVRAISSAQNAVTGIDIAPSATTGASAFPKTGNEQYALVNLFDLPPEMCGTYDWIWEHTCFCAIDPTMRNNYARGVTAALKPGGHYLAIFYLDPGHDNDGPPYGVTLPELDAYFSDSFELLREWLPTKAYPGREGREWMRLMRKR